MAVAGAAGGVDGAVGVAAATGPAVAPTPAVGGRLPLPSAVALTVSRIFLASSIAIDGTGGELRLTILAASRPAPTAITSRIAAIAKKPQKYA